jgi:putative ABC transport system permease protein
MIDLEKAIRRQLTAGQSVRSAHSIYKASMAVFEQTFAITETLRGLAAGIAVIGVFGALTALQLERFRQAGILRAIGVTPGQLYRLIATETGLMGLCAGLIALPVGYLIAYELIFVIYRRSFGWTMAFYFHPEILLQGLFLAFSAALLAGLLPARKLAQIQPAEALRAE